jgi:predicted RNA-binding protein YlqC (UPF0109 family)
MDNSIDQQFIEYVVKSLVGNPEEVKVERSVDEKGVLLELTVDPEDLGRVIGKRGATAQSLRTLLRALGTKNDARYNLKIVDNGSPAPAKSSSKSDDSTATDDDTKPAQEVDAPAAAAATEDDIFSVPKDKPEESDVVSKTRKELEDLDDLDI